MPRTLCAVASGTAAVLNLGAGTSVLFSDHSVPREALRDPLVLALTTPGAQPATPSTATAEPSHGAEHVAAPQADHEPSDPATVDPGRGDRHPRPVERLGPAGR